jgi:sporulation protein YlmC with PRC-barrel domain
MSDGEGTVVPTGPGTKTWRASQLAHRPVVDVQCVEQIGDVVDLVFDPQNCHLAGLLVQRTGPEGSIAELTRRALGRVLGLVFVPVEQVLALDAEVVTLDPARPIAGQRERTSQLPRLSKVLGFAVVTLRGQRLGRLVDLLLGDEGRRLAGYLVEPGGQGAAARRGPERMIWLATHATTHTTDGGSTTALAAPAGPLPEIGTVEQPIGATQLVDSPVPLLVIAASPNVRVGRNLVVVARDGDSSAHRLHASTFAPPAWLKAVDQPTEEAGQPAWYHGAADTPTQQMRR